MHIRSLATLSTALVLALAAPAAAAPPDSDREPDAVGDVVRTYADGHTSTGYGRSDIRWVRMHSIHSGGGGKAVDVVVQLTEVDQRMFENHVRLTVRFTAGNGHVGRTEAEFRRHSTRITIEGFHAENCVPYPRRSPARDRIAISLPDACWPVAKSVRVRTLVRYDFAPQGRARDAAKSGPIAIP